MKTVISKLFGLTLLAYLWWAYYRFIWRGWVFYYRGWREAKPPEWISKLGLTASYEANKPSFLGALRGYFWGGADLPGADITRVTFAARLLQNRFVRWGLAVLAIWMLLR